MGAILGAEARDPELEDRLVLFLGMQNLEELLYLFLRVGTSPGELEE